MCLVADRGAFELDQRRRQRPRRRRYGERRDALLDDLRDRLKLGEALDARLGLRGLAGLRPKAIDEALQVRTLGFLLDLCRGLQPALFRPSRFEIVVAAGINRACLRSNAIFRPPNYSAARDRG